MNSEEQTLIDGLFSKLRQAEADSAPRDTLAEARIKEHLTQQPSAPYYMAQAILVQEAAIKQLDGQSKQLTEQIKQLQAQLQQAQAQAAAPAPSSGGFLSSIFGSSREPQPQAQPQSFSQPRPASAPPSSGGWRDPAPSNPPPYNAPPGNYAAPPQGQFQPQAPAAPMGSGFLGGALKTAAGVAGGVMLAEGISSLFHHNQQQPQEIVEIIKEEPSQASDHGNNGNDWGNDNQRVTSNDSYGNDQGGFDDTDYGNDDGGMFSDDDSFV